MNGLEIASLDGIAEGAKTSGAPRARKRFFVAGGRRNALKRLKTAKEIKGNQSLFL
jgi:hypothetical protein